MINRDKISIKDALNKTITWYKEYFTNEENIQEFTKNQISEYVEQAKKMNIDWASNI